MTMQEHTKIPMRVREAVLRRDSILDAPCCIVCGSPYGIELAHYIPRSRGGMGEERNLVCLCGDCHKAEHNGDKEVRERMRNYLMSLYPRWSESDLIYDKWRKEE